MKGNFPLDGGVSVKENYPRYPVAILIPREPEKRLRIVTVKPDTKTRSAHPNPFGTAFDNKSK